ncbi:MAG: hypothetical protein EPN47_10300 [Acidobacteria bacterium]|nr:MAG: hypothetical protein EPN47_10300 [Acidobacteriota bacterium]
MRASPGEFICWSEEERNYWFFSARDGLERFRQVAFAHSNECELQEIARSDSGLPVYRLRLGCGRTQVAFLSGMHGPEPSGPRGLLTFLDMLLNGAKPFGISVDASRILSTLTLNLFPLMNPGGAERFSHHFPDCWHPTWLPNWDDADIARFYAEGNEPNKFFNGSYVKTPPMRFTPQQIAQWEATGHELGSSLTDGGLDMWFDWDDTQAPETRAVKAALSAIRPLCVADYHNFMFPSEVFAPTPYSQGKLRQDEIDLALAVQREWHKRGLPFHERPPRPYTPPREKYHEDYWIHSLGARALIVEFNGGKLVREGAEYEPTPATRPLTRKESLESAVTATIAIVEHLAEVAPAL